jgi:hypothetical protein
MQQIMPIDIARRAAGACLLLAFLYSGQARADLKLEGSVVKTGRHQITIDKTGLPAQIVIEPDPAELPLPLRAPGAVPGQSDLQMIGRGPQLRSPIQLQALIGGQTLTAEPAKPAQPAAAADGVACQADLRAGALRLTLKTQVGPDGSLQGEIKYGGQNVEVEKLDLVLELAGLVDTIVAGPPVGVEGTVYPPTATEVGSGEGVVWKNVVEDKALSKPGVLTHCFLGSGDRGFTWLTPNADGFAVDAKLPTMVVERNKEGAVTWRISLVNAPAKVKDERTVSFALLVHPAKTNAPSRRADAWKPWTGAPALPALSWAARKPGLDLVRADLATVHEAVAARAVLEGPGGGEAVSAAATLADTFPLGLFRYLAAPHTALPVQLRTNARKLSAPGASPACDRIAIGRALLHDIGVDPAGLGQRVSTAGILQALDAFGFFADDGKMEFLPYWRSGDVVRYGEAFQKGDVFAVTDENPTARVHVSVFLRPTAKDATKSQALFVVVNEGDKPLREQFYILQPARCFGGQNVISAASIIRKWDFSKVPKDSDWRQEVMIGSAQPDRELPGVHLRDLEDNGFVQARSFGGGMEIYGLLYVPARSFRLVYGAGAQ